MSIDQPPTINPFVYTAPPMVRAKDLHTHGNLVVVERLSGDVLIDWKAAEAYAADPQSDWHMRAYAQMLLAVRDGTWKPLPDDTH